MLKTFKAFLQDGHLEWIGDRPDLGNEPLLPALQILRSNFGKF